MITDGKKWHYNAVKNLSASLRGVTSNHDRDFYYLNRFHSYSTIVQKKHEKVCYDHDCHVEMSYEDNKILKHNYGENSLKTPFIIYTEIECLLEKMH